MRKTIFNFSLLGFTGLILILTIWGPEALANYQDRRILGRPSAEAVGTTGEGYRYTLSGNERLFIVAQALSSQILPATDLSAMTQEVPMDAEYQEMAENYAFVVNHRGPSGQEITDTEIYETCNRDLAALKEAGIIPEEVGPVEAAAYNAVLYSAIDILEPRNNVAVWKLTLSDSQINRRKENRLLDIYIDADSGKIYEFYARTQRSWAEIDTDEIINKWSEYLGLGQPVPYETANPLQETTQFFAKYLFTGMGEENTIVTVGFYEGINELFIKVT